MISSSYPEVLTLAEHLSQRHGVSAEHLSARDDCRDYRQLLETSLVGSSRAVDAAAAAVAAPSLSASSSPSASSSAALGRRSLSDPTSRLRHGNDHGNGYGQSDTNDHGHALKRSYSLSSGAARAQPPSRRVRRHRSRGCSFA